MIMLFPVAFLLSILPLFYSVLSQSSKACSAYNSTIACNTSAYCSWNHNDYCKCTSNASLDILFMMDASASIGETNFEKTKAWLQQLIIQDIPYDSRIGITLFAANINNTAQIQYWNTSDLIQHIRSLSYPTQQFTLTDSALVSAIEQFSYIHHPDRDKLLILQTGNDPCAPDTAGGCPYSICQYKSILEEAGIYAVIVGVEQDLFRDYVECASNDYIDISSYDELQPNHMDGLGDILCPNGSLPNIFVPNITSAVTFINVSTIWTDDFQYDVSNTVHNPYFGINWYSVTGTGGALNGNTVFSPSLDELHGWFTYCAPPCDASQINREFVCNQYDDYHNYSVTIAFDVFIGCREQPNNGLSYSRYSPTAGLNIIKALDIGDSVWEKSDKIPSSCSKQSVSMFSVLDKFYVNDSETISITMWLDIASTNEAVAFGPFMMVCDPITWNPTKEPTTEPTANPTKEPTIEPTIKPTMQPSIEPTTEPTVQPSIEPTIEPTNEPTSYPTIHPTVTTGNPSFVPTVIPTNDPTATSNPQKTISTDSADESPTLKAKAISIAKFIWKYAMNFKLISLIISCSILCCICCIIVICYRKRQKRLREYYELSEKRLGKVLGNNVSGELAPMDIELELSNQKKQKKQKKEEIVNTKPEGLMNVTQNIIDNVDLCIEDDEESSSEDDEEPSSEIKEISNDEHMEGNDIYNKNDCDLTEKQIMIVNGLKNLDIKNLDPEIQDLLLKILQNQ